MSRPQHAPEAPDTQDVNVTAVNPRVLCARCDILSPSRADVTLHTFHTLSQNANRLTHLANKRTKNWLKSNCDKWRLIKLYSLKVNETSLS